MNFDSNALYRHPDVVELRDLTEEDPKEVEASKFDLNYIALDGSVACMVNGAGLAMATMDIIKHYGGSPANFLGVGARPRSRWKNAFRILVADDAVKAILVNIFGGIMKCGVIATGIVNAAHNLELSVPLVVRLEAPTWKRAKRFWPTVVWLWNLPIRLPRRRKKSSSSPRNRPNPEKENFR